MVPDKVKLDALKRLSDALGSPDARFLMTPSRYPLLYAAAVLRGDVFEKCVELRGLEPLAFWMQTKFLECFYVAGSRLTVRLPAEIVGDCRWASPGVWLRWLFVWLFFEASFWAGHGNGTRGARV